MQASGSGLTFTDHDVKMCRVVIGLLSLAKFNNVDVTILREGHPACQWVEELLKQIKDHVFEMGRVIEPPKEEAKPEPKKAKK